MVHSGALYFNRTTHYAYSAIGLRYIASDCLICNKPMFYFYVWPKASSCNMVHNQCNDQLQTTHVRLRISQLKLSGLFQRMIKTTVFHTHNAALTSSIKVNSHQVLYETFSTLVFHF